MVYKQSILQKNPRSKVIKKGYINIYSQLTPSEERYIFYNTVYKKLHPNWDNTQIALNSLFNVSLPNKAIVLDYGCGHGNYLIDESRTKIAWAVGIDINHEDTKKNLCLDEIQITNGDTIPYPDYSFDSVIALWVLEHVKDPENCLNEIYRVLKPGGEFFFATPNKYYILITIKRLFEIIRIDTLLSSILYGRKIKDIFPTLYKANTVSDLERHLKVAKFNKFEVRENFDPGYSSFNNFTFKITELVSNINSSIVKAHLYGWAKK
jgi:SAM-dependent methyltransferase